MYLQCIQYLSNFTEKPHTYCKNITSGVQSNLMSNKLGKLSSFTVLNEWKNRIIKKWEIERRVSLDLDLASLGRPNLEMMSVNQACLEQASVEQVQLIEQDVDCFYEFLSRFDFLRLEMFQENRRFDDPVIQWREGFRRFKLLSENPSLTEIGIDQDDDEIGQSFLAEEVMFDEALDFDDDESDDDEYVITLFSSEIF